MRRVDSLKDISLTVLINDNRLIKRPYRARKVNFQRL